MLSKKSEDVLNVVRNVYKIVEGKEEAPKIELKEVDMEVAKRKLHFLGIEIDSLTAEQEKYLNSWNV